MKTCTVKAWDSIKSAIDKQYVMSKAHEIRTGSGETVPKDAIHLNAIRRHELLCLSRRFLCL